MNKLFLSGSGLRLQAVSWASCPGAILCGLLALVAVATADIPKKAPSGKYTSLWTDSPFTSKPPVVEGPPTANPLDDYTLTGIAPVPGGYRITIISKKDPTQKRIIGPGGSKEFTVVSVNRDPNKLLGTSVVLSTGSMQGTVTFEPELITLNAAPAAAPQQNLPPGVNPQQAGLPPGVQIQANGQTAQREPRPRIVPPPQAGGGNQRRQQQQAQPTNTQQGRPQGQRDRRNRR